MTRIKKYLPWFFLVIIPTLIYWGYQVPWTGFGKWINAENKTISAKNLWDWLGLIVVPAALAGFGFWFNSRQKRQSDIETERAEVRTRDEAKRAEYLEQAKNQSYFETELVRSYLDKMTELILEKQLNIDGPEEVQVIAKARTISVLRSILNKTRKNVILDFLRDSGLSDFVMKKDNLRKAHLEGASFYEANLERANLFEAKLERAYLRKAHLDGAILEGANLKGAFLGKANLEGALLGGANLEGAGLKGANLEGANLQKANLEGVTGLTAKQLSETKSLVGAKNIEPTLLDELKQKFPKDFERIMNRTKAYDILHDEVKAKQKVKTVQKRKQETDTTKLNILDEIQSVVIGEKYQRGIIFYIDASGKHGLIASPTDQSDGVQWYNGENIKIEATGIAIGTGDANSNKIIKAQGEGNYAAKKCSDLVLAGYSDWYLPSKDELNQLLRNKEAVGGFTMDNYWSSTEAEDFVNFAWYQSISKRGFQEIQYKKRCYRVRAIQAF